MAVEIDLDEDEIRQAVVAMENRTVLSLDVPVEQGAPPLDQLLPDTEERNRGREPDHTARAGLQPPGGRAGGGGPVLLHGLKQHEIGALIGCSQMQVSRLLRRSCERLHDQLVTSDA